MDDELRGVKGWLLTFVIVIALVSPGISALRVYGAFNGPEFAFVGDNPVLASLRNVAWATVAFAALVGWFVAFRLFFVHNWLSVRLAIAGIWLASVGTLVFQYVGVTYVVGLPAEALLQSLEPQDVIRPLIFGIVWTAYLLKSERVESTYRPGEDDAEVFE